MRLTPCVKLHEALLNLHGGQAFVKLLCALSELGQPCLSNAGVVLDKCLSSFHKFVLEKIHYWLADAHTRAHASHSNVALVVSAALTCKNHLQKYHETAAHCMSDICF